MYESCNAKKPMKSNITCNNTFIKGVIIVLKRIIYVNSKQHFNWNVFNLAKKVLPQPFHKVIMLEYTAESLFILTAKFLVCTHVKSRSCFKFVFSSSLLFLRLKFIFKETTDFVCVVFHLNPPLFLLRSVIFAVVYYIRCWALFNGNIVLSFLYFWKATSKMCV